MKANKRTAQAILKQIAIELGRQALRGKPASTSKLAIRCLQVVRQDRKGSQP